MESDIELLESYMNGFNDELLGARGNYNTDPINWKERAYAVGRLDAILGDENSMIDLQTNEQILKRIKI